jgi:hypothetical protein
MQKFFLTIIVISFVFGVNAQIRYGVKVGGTLSNLTSKYDGTKANDSKAGVGFNIGGLMEYSFSESLSLQPELLYLHNNVKAKESDDKIKIQSIQLPVNLKYKMGVENLKFYVAAGPYLGYIVSARKTTKTDGRDYSENLLDKTMKNFDFGLGIGFGVEISNFAVGVGYQYGLANIDKRDKMSSKSGTFNLSVGYFF